MSDLQQHTVSSFLVQELYNLGVRHIFGVPGDFVLAFYQYLNRSNRFKIINTCDEQGAGFAADAYARIRGLGVVCITYCVGGLKVVNAAAQAFAEKSPLIIISGSPGIYERRKNPLIHHKVRDFDTQLEIFKHITVDSVVLSDPKTAIKDIKRVLHSATRYKRPVYIELPRDKVFAPVSIEEKEQLGQQAGQQQLENHSNDSDKDILTEALIETKTMVNLSKHPVIVAGVEIHRFGLQQALLNLIEKTKIPVVSTVLSKSVISEDHPSYLGVYEGAMGHKSVREYVESSDCLVLLGAPMTDVNFSISPTPIEQSKTIYATAERLSIKHHNFENVQLKDFVNGLIDQHIGPDISNRTSDVIMIEKRRKQQQMEQELKKRELYKHRRETITVKYLFERLNLSVNNRTVVIADTGDALFGSLDLTIHGQTEFLCPAYYLSMGFAVPAAIGAQLADSGLRPIVIVGDGAFQMTGMEVSTIVRFGLNPIIIVLNNSGYGTERPIIDGPFNDILPWDYSRIPQVLGYGKGFVVETEDEFDRALSESEKIYDRELCIIDVRLDVHDGSEALQRITEAFHDRVQ